MTDEKIKVKSENGQLIEVVVFSKSANRIEVVEYANVQFTKAPHVLRGMGLKLDKSLKALQELADKGMAPDAA